MNYEQISLLIIKNWKKIKNKKSATRFLIWNSNVLNIKKQKLKLGLVSFEIKKIMVNGLPFPVFEYIDIKYVRQDTTDEDALKVENRIDALKFKNKIFYYFFITFLLLFSIYLSYLLIFNWLAENFPDLVLANPNKKQILEFVFKSLLDLPKSFNFFLFSRQFNDFLVNSILDLSILLDYLI